ncbi:MAG: hypothetical protein ACKVZH_07600 [Blastocatellia bacterium]
MHAVRIFKQTISILLAAQLLVSFGLCGGLCCLKPAEAAAPEAIAQTAEADESLPPCHRKKAAEAQQRQTHSTHQLSATNQHSVSKAASMLNRNCCAMKGETPEGELLPPTIAPEAGKLVVAITVSPWRCAELAFGSPINPFQTLATHLPPYTGFQLSLRI